MAKGCDISREADVGEMSAAVARLQPDDAAVVGDAAPDVRIAGGVAQKGEFTVLQAGGGAKPQHVALQGNPFQGQMLAHIALDQIRHRVCDGEIGHDGQLLCSIASGFHCGRPASARKSSDLPKRVFISEHWQCFSERPTEL